MGKSIEELLQEALDIHLVEMANLDKRRTGFTNQNLVVYISTKQGSHGPRVKVFLKGNPKDSISFSIEKEPKKLTESKLKLSQKEISEIKYWISINSVELLKLWNTNYQNVEIFDVLRNLDKI